MFRCRCNPCPCGFLGDDTDRCRCSQSKIEAYRNRLSGPLLDRIDLQIHVPKVAPEVLRDSTLRPESSEQVRHRVSAAINRQIERQGKANMELGISEIEQFCGLCEQDYAYLDAVANTLHFSNRAYHRVLRVARTIADMDAEQNIVRAHLAEAISMRILVRS